VVRRVECCESDAPWSTPPGPQDGASRYGNVKAAQCETVTRQLRAPNPRVLTDTWFGASNAEKATRRGRLCPVPRRRYSAKRAGNARAPRANPPCVGRHGVGASNAEKVTRRGQLRQAPRWRLACREREGGVKRAVSQQETRYRYSLHIGNARTPRADHPRVGGHGCGRLRPAPRRRPACAKAALSVLGTRECREPESRVLPDTGSARQMLRKRRAVVDPASLETHSACCGTRSRRIVRGVEREWCAENVKYREPPPPVVES